MYSQKFDSEKRLFKFCPSSWGHKELDTTEQLTDNNNNIFIHRLAKQTSYFFFPSLGTLQDSAVGSHWVGGKSLF